MEDIRKGFIYVLHPLFMCSQVRWGSFFIILGLAIVPVMFPLTLLYSVPLLLIGAGLIAFRKREEEIEEI